MVPTRGGSRGICQPCGGSRDPSRGRISQCACLSELQSEFSLAADYSKLQSELKNWKDTPETKKEASRSTRKATYEEAAPPTTATDRQQPG